MNSDRWVPAYDADSLIAIIEDVRNSLGARSFYSRMNPVADYCQGDIVQMDTELPIIDSQSEPASLERNSNLWVIIGNTCDFDRDIDKLPWTQVVPLDQIGTRSDIAEPDLAELRSYRASRYFYMPDWQSGSSTKHYLAQLGQPATTHKEAVQNAKLIARLSQSAWYLLSACIVRFLARDDGRFEF